MQNATTRDTWNTKYGPRRVKHDPPTLQEAIFAAKGIADDLASQVEIAASLIGLPQDQVRAELLKSRSGTLGPVQSIATGRGGAQRTVVVERIGRRPIANRRFGL